MINTKILEDNLAFTMVDFFKEHQKIIRMGLASNPRDVNDKKFYRVIAKNRKFIKPKNGLLIRGAYAECDGKIHGLGCDGLVKFIHPTQETPEGHLLLKMKGVLDFSSKCLAKCSCGTTFMIYADASVGEPDTCYLAIITVSQPKTVLPIVPFLKVDSIAVVQFQD